MVGRILVIGLFAVLVACEPGSKSSTTIDPDNPNAVSKALAIKVGDLSAERKEGDPPDTTTTGLEPFLTALLDKIIVRPGDKASVDFGVESSALLQSLFAKVFGAQDYLQVDLSGSTKAESGLTVLIDVPKNINDGEFCLEFSAADVSARVSPVETVCVEVRAEQNVPQPTGSPTAAPTAQPSQPPAAEPTATLHPSPTVQPTGQPTAPPTSSPTATPTPSPSAQPTPTPAAFQKQDLLGGWSRPLPPDQASSAQVFHFFADDTFVFAYTTENPNCLNGLEWGRFSYNDQTQTVQQTQVFVDTSGPNGECGFYEDGFGLPFRVSASGSTGLVATFDDEGETVSFSFDRIPSGPGFNGSWQLTQGESFDGPLILSLFGESNGPYFFSYAASAPDGGGRGIELGSFAVDSQGVVTITTQIDTATNAGLSGESGAVWEIIDETSFSLGGLIFERVPQSLP